MQTFPVETDVLFEMLKYMRPHESNAETEFMSKYLDTITGMQKDGFGNRYITIGNSPTTMFSSHVDTVHKLDGKQGLIYHKDCALIERDHRDGLMQPLGADDGAGVWIMLNMIEAGIPGLYIFHRAEERGGIGSRFVAAHNAKLLDGIERAIAFDRAGDTDVITWQGGDVCCSDEFAIHFSNLLSSKHISMAPCDNGIFTDTANYTHLIPECTNISVGYDAEHTVDECLDLWFLLELTTNILEVDFNKLPTVRDVNAVSDKRMDFVNRWAGTSPTQMHSSRNPWLSTADLWELYYDNGIEFMVKLCDYIGVKESDVEEVHAEFDILFDNWTAAPFK